MRMSRVSAFVLVCAFSSGLANAQEAPDRAGLSGSVYLERETLVEGEPVLFAMRLINTSDRDLFVWTPPSELDTADPIRLALAPVGRPERKRSMPHTVRLPGAARVVRFRPGETRIWRFRLQQVVEPIEKDTYGLEVVYFQGYATGGVIGKRPIARETMLAGSLSLGTVHFTVIEGQGEERTVYERCNGFSGAFDAMFRAYPNCSYVRDYYRFMVGTETGKTEALEEMVRLQPGFYLTDDAMMILARREAEAGKPELARGWLTRLLKEYPKSDRREEAEFNLKRGFTID